MMMEFPNLRAEMARRGLTISGMAQELGMSRDTLARWLNGGMRVKDALKIRERYFPDCELDHLFEKKD